MNCLNKLVHLLFFTFMSCCFALAQIPYSETNFRAPLDIPLVLAGTFGELRSNHFHSGIDIKTKGQEGFPVIAIEDGYVSRVKTNPGGYGKALYLTHYNVMFRCMLICRVFIRMLQLICLMNSIKSNNFLLTSSLMREALPVKKEIPLPGPGIVAALLHLICILRFGMPKPKRS